MTTVKVGVDINSPRITNYSICSTRDISSLLVKSVQVSTEMLDNVEIKQMTLVWITHFTTVEKET